MTVNEIIIAPIAVTTQEIIAPVTLDALQVTAPMAVSPLQVSAPITLDSQQVDAAVVLNAVQVTAPIFVGQRGTDGEPGPAGGVVVSCTAGETLGGHRVVVLNAAAEAVYASNAVPEHLHKVLGLTTGSALLGTEVTVQAGGELTEPAWAWTLDAPIFLGENGLLTQTPPVSGFMLVVAFPITETKIYIKLREPLALT